MSLFLVCMTLSPVEGSGADESEYGPDTDGRGFGDRIVAGANDQGCNSKTIDRGWIKGIADLTRANQGERAYEDAGIEWGEGIVFPSAERLSQGWIDRIRTVGREENTSSPRFDIGNGIPVDRPVVHERLPEDRPGIRNIGDFKIPKRIEIARDRVSGRSRKIELNPLGIGVENEFLGSDVQQVPRKRIGSPVERHGRERKIDWKVPASDPEGAVCVDESAEGR